MASNSENISMAVFCDFENVALGVRDANYEKFDIKPVLERLLLKGSIVVKKAYCDWDRYKGFKSTMHEANFELIEIPHVRQSGKNSADIRLVVDALDLCYTKSHVNTFVIISGDSDFSPLVSKLRENAKQVIGVGVKQSTSDLLVANCDEFIFYDDLVREVSRAAAKRKEVQDARKAQPQQKRPGDDRRKEELEARKTQALEMVVETFDALVSERGDTGKIWASLLKDTLKRRRPEFSEVYYGFRTFGNLLEEAQARGLFEFGRDEKSGTYVYRSSTGPVAVAEQSGADLSDTPMAGEDGAAQDGQVAREQTREETRGEGRGRGRGRGRNGRGQVGGVAAGEGVDAAAPQDAPEAREEAQGQVQAQGEGHGRGTRGRKSAYRTVLPFVPVTPDEVAQVEAQAEAPTELFDVDDVAAAGAWTPVAGDAAAPEPAGAAEADEAQPEPAKKERRRAPRKTAAKKGAAAAIDAAADTVPADTAATGAAAAPAIAAQDPSAALTVSPPAQAAPADELDDAYEEEDDVNGNVMPGSRKASGPARKGTDRKPSERQAAARKPAARSRRPAKPKSTPGNE